MFLYILKRQTFYTFPLKKDQKPLRYTLIIDYVIQKHRYTHVTRHTQKKYQKTRDNKTHIKTHNQKEVRKKGIVRHHTNDYR